MKLFQLERGRCGPLRDYCGLKFSGDRKKYFQRLFLERGIFHPENVSVEYIKMALSIGFSLYN